MWYCTCTADKSVLDKMGLATSSEADKVGPKKLESRAGAVESVETCVCVPRVAGTLCFLRKRKDSETRPGFGN